MSKSPASPKSSAIFNATACMLLALGLAAPAAAGPSMLVDADTGRVLEQEDAFARWYPASLTKLMTTYVAFRAIDAGEVTLNSPVRISERATKEPPSKMGYPAGTVITLDAALKILMVKSANDVATAVGESLAGSQEAFAARMNAEAERIGMTGSHFVNAHGLHDDRQYTTARDLALLALTLRKEYPQHAGYFAVEAIGPGNDIIENHNTLIGRFAGANGMKTGYTCPAGYNLVATATQNGRTMLAVVIGATSVGKRADKAADLLGAGFAAKAVDPQAPFLAAMATPAGGAAEATNMRGTVCTAEAAKARRAELDKNGKLVLKSAFLAATAPIPAVTPIVTGNATGPKSPFAPKFVRPMMVGNLPVPMPRPDRGLPETAIGSENAQADGTRGVLQ